MSDIYSRAYACLLLCFITVIGSSSASASVKYFVSTKSLQTKADIAGKIIKINRAASETGNDNFLGSIYVEGSGNYDRANINVNAQTRISVSNNGKRRAANLDSLKVGARIQAIFTGPVLESYPVRATAEEIIIFAEDVGNEKSNRGSSSGKIVQTLLPPAVRAVLNADYPNWKTARITERAAEFYRSQSKDAPPQILEGDFDGNGRTDYAVNVIYIKTRKQTQAFIVFLSKGRGFTKRVLESYPYSGDDFQTGVFLTLEKKGETGFDYEANKTFRFKNDAVEVIYFEKVSAVYIYEQGKFRRILTDD